MWYTTNVESDVVNAARDLAVHMSNPGTEHQKALGRMIGYLKVKNTKCIIIRNTKVLKAVMSYDSNWATNKETRNTVSGIVTTIKVTLRLCSSNTQITITLSSTESEYMALSKCLQ